MAGPPEEATAVVGIEWLEEALGGDTVANIVGDGNAAHDSWCGRIGCGSGVGGGRGPRAGSTPLSYRGGFLGPRPLFELQSSGCEP